VPTDTPMRSDEFSNLPVAQTWRRVDFDWVSIEAATADHSAVVMVGGIKHWLNLRVELVPRCYQSRPEFWGIEVVGALPGYGVSSVVDYNVTLQLDGIHGTQGIEIIGATKCERRLWRRNESP
jgi:hypothetical protein